MQKGLVSIITPCYNTGTIVHRLLDSILIQDYPFVEMYVIDDGSSDNTKSVIKSYIPKFQKKGYRLFYKYQENSGQSVAINNGLKLVNGEYLMWPDSDDFYVKSDIISQMVAKMVEGNFDMGRCRIQFVDEEELHVISIGTQPEIDTYDQFDNIVFNKGGFMFPPVAFILRMEALDDAIPEREIYTEKNAGQNWQIMMPLSYHRNMFFLDMIGASVLARHESHSRGQFSGYEQRIIIEDAYKRTLCGTLNRMPYMPYEEKIKYLTKIELKYLHKKMQLAIGQGKAKDALIFLKDMEKLSNTKQPFFTILFCYFCDCKPVFLILRVIRKIFGLEI